MNPLFLITASLALILNAQAQTFVTNGLVGYWPFNGNANDYSGNGYDGVVNGAKLTTDRFGNTNAAYQLDGSTSIITIPSNTNFDLAGNFSLSIWVKATTFASLPEVLFSKSYSGDNQEGWFMAFENLPLPSIQFQAAPYFDTNAPQSSLIYAGIWEQYVFSFNKTNGQCNLYLNGALVDSRTKNYSLNNSPYNVTIGAQQIPFGSSGYGYYFNGAVADVRIYNRTLESYEVAQLFLLESAPIVGIQKAVYLTSSNLHAGTNYVVQASTDLVNWTNQGSVFTATTNFWRTTNYWDVANWNQLYFRLQQQ